MSPVSVEAIKALRDKTSASIDECRKALTAAGGDEKKAIAILRQRGAELAAKRSGRAAAEGRVETYLHHDGKLAVVVEVNCETDFVARTPQFVQFCRDVAMQVAAMNPQQVGDAAAGANGEGSLLAQPFVKDASQTVGDLLKALVATTGENVVIRRFARFGLGESVGG